MKWISKRRLWLARDKPHPDGRYKGEAAGITFTKVKPRFIRTHPDHDSPQHKEFASVGMWEVDDGTELFICDPEPIFGMKDLPPGSKPRRVVVTIEEV